MLIWKVRAGRGGRARASGARVTSSAVEEDAAGVRGELAGDQVDQRGLAGAVRADQRVAGAARQGDRDVAGDLERAEALRERFGAEARVIGRRVDVSRARPARRARPPRMPLGMTRTTTISRRPIQKYQYCGFMPASWSRASMKMSAPRMRAVEAAGAAEDQHDDDVGRALEAQGVERDGVGGLGEERAGGAGHRGGDRVDRSAGARGGRSRSPACGGRSRGCRAAPGRRRSCTIRRLTRKPRKSTASA